MNDLTTPDDEDDARALVLAEIDRLVEAGGAKRAALSNGDIEVRFASEVFRVGETLITRIA
jgi:hypothetical protein